MEIPSDNLGTSHSFVERQIRNIPSTDNKIVGMDHRQRVTEGDIGIIVGDRIGSQMKSGNTKDRSDVVRLLDTNLGVPDNVVTVGEDGSGEIRALVSSNANHHQPER